MTTTLAAALLDSDDPTGPQDIDGGLADRLESLEQRIVQRLKYRRGEWFLNPGGGTETVIGRQISVPLATSIIADAIRDEGAAEVVDVAITSAVLNPATRLLDWAAEVATIYGPTTITGTAG